MTAPDPAQVCDLGQCCICNTTGDRVRVVVRINRQAPIPGTGWGCFVCDLPKDGALAVICTDCERAVGAAGLPIGAKLKSVCYGRPADRIRVSVHRLGDEFRCDPVKHQETSRGLQHGLPRWATQQGR